MNSNLPRDLSRIRRRMVVYARRTGVNSICRFWYPTRPTSCQFWQRSGPYSIYILK